VAVKPELLFPFAPLRENQEFKTDAPPGHGLTATLALLKISYPQHPELAKDFRKK